MLCLVINFSFDCWADEALDKIAKDNIPDWLYSQAHGTWETTNAIFQEVSRPLLGEDKIVQWKYSEADLDSTGNRDYLIVVYGDYCESISLVILKKQEDTYAKIWTLSSNQELRGGISDAAIMITDINGDYKPEIIVRTHTGMIAYTSIIKWEESNSYPILPDSFSNSELVDLDRDGTKEILCYSNQIAYITLPDGTVDQTTDSYCDVYKFDGTNYVFVKKVDSTSPTFGVLFLASQIAPLQWPLSWATTGQSDYIKATLSAIDESHAVTEIDPASVRLEDRVKPVRTWIEGGTFLTEFDKQAVMQYLIKTPRLKPLAGGDKINITVSALLTTGQYVSGSIEVEIQSALTSATLTTTGAYFINGTYRESFASNLAYNFTTQIATGSLKCNFITIGGRASVQTTSVTSASVPEQGTLIFSGACTVNGTAGYTYAATFKDVANPGAGKDIVSITITGPNNYKLEFLNKTIAAGDIAISAQ